MVSLPKDMDKECISLCNAINRFKGLRTIESCCGHGNTPYHIWFKADSLGDLPPMLYYLDVCHCGCRGWSVEVYTDCAMSPVTFMIEGSIGEETYEESEKIAKIMNEYNKK